MMEEYSRDDVFEQDEMLDRREIRMRRRKRNEIIIYTVSAVLLVLILGGSIFGITKLVRQYQDKKSAEELARQQEEIAEGLQEPIIVEAPQQVSDEIIEPAESEKSDLDKIVDACIAELPVEDKVAGLFFITPEALTGTNTVIRAGDTTKEKLGQYAVGGLVYFDQNIQSADQIKEMLSNTKSMSKYQIFLGVDEEGGSVARVADNIDVPEVDSMAAIGESGDASLAYEAGATIGTYLSELGFNVDFAPVADLSAADADNGIAERSFGEDAQAVSGMVAGVVEGIQSAGVSACVKHFPGLGEMTEDTHSGMVVSEKSKEELLAQELAAFKAGIESGTQFVMVSHLSLPNINGDNTPASISKTVITDILRGDLGYEGIVITDAFNMSAITEYYTSEEAAVNAILAGADMILMPEDFEQAYQGVLQAVENGIITGERLDESLRRIYRVKYADKVDE